MALYYCSQFIVHVILFQQVNSYVVPHIGNVKWFSVYSLSSVVFPLLMYACIQCTVYKKIFAPVFFLPLSPWSWSVGEFKTGCTNSNVFNYLFSKKKKKCLGDFRTAQNRLQVYRRVKKTWGENNPVYSICEIHIRITFTQRRKNFIIRNEKLPNVHCCPTFVVLYFTFK